MQFPAKNVPFVPRPFQPEPKDITIQNLAKENFMLKDQLQRLLASTMPNSPPFAPRTVIDQPKLQPPTFKALPLKLIDPLENKFAQKMDRLRSKTPRKMSKASQRTKSDQEIQLSKKSGTTTVKCLLNSTEKGRNFANLSSKMTPIESVKNSPQKTTNNVKYYRNYDKDNIFSTASRVKCGDTLPVTSTSPCRGEKNFAITYAQRRAMNKSMPDTDLSQISSEMFRRKVENDSSTISYIRGASYLEEKSSRVSDSQGSITNRQSKHEEPAMKENTDQDFILSLEQQTKREGLKKRKLRADIYLVQEEPKGKGHRVRS